MKWRVVMLRKLAVFIVSAGLTMSPLSVEALGFGGIKLKSSLNEKLNAEVDLLSATANDVQSLTINLASEEAFLRAGLDRTALLNKLKFEVKQRTNGDYYIQVTTSETVREPFMNFLLDINWKNGRMLREYTMLIDPPGRAPKRLAEPGPSVSEIMALEPKVEPAIASAAPGFEEKTPDVAVIEEPSPFVEPVVEPVPELMPEPAMETADATTSVEMEQPEPVEMVEPVVEIPAAAETDSSAPAFEPEAVFEEDSDELWPRIPLTAYSESSESEATSDSPGAVASGGEMGDLDYGITQKNDKLWNIAEKLRQGDESVTVYQVMMALLQSNPDAFINNNVNRLKVGHVLRISDPSLLTAMSRKEAAKSFTEQTNAWNNYRQQAAKAAGVQPIMAGSDEASADGAATDASGELTLSAPDGESLSAGGGANEETLSNDLATMQDQLRQAKKDAGTMRTRNVALNDKLQSLEDELNRLQRSLSVKDDELAALQQQLSSLNQQPVEVKPEAAPMVEKAAPVEEDEPMVDEKPMVAEETITPSVKAPTAEQPKPEKSPVELAEDISKNETAAAEPGIMDTVMGVITSIGAAATGILSGISLGGDSLLFIIAPIVLVVLFIVIIMVRRRRQGDNFQESILTGAATASAGNAGGPVSGDSTTFSEESSFLSDFAMSGASAIEADDSEVDPLTEADVFMAYGRYEAAEERLNEAVQNEPDRMELRAKLLELHHTTQNKGAFEDAAEDFYARLGGAEANSPLWEKVVTMGQEIAPENPLFSQGAGSDFSSDIRATSETPAMNDIGMNMTDSQVMDIGLETGVFAAADLNAAAGQASDDMDFNLDLGDSLTSAPESNDDMDFNLDIGGGEDAAKEPAADLDFNLDMGSSDSTDDAGLDFNLDTGGEDSAKEPVADLDFSLDMSSSDSTEDAGLDFNLDMDSSSDDISLDMDLNLDASDTADADIGGGDEVGTKLDLAKAYIDMGDPEGARSILDEVMDEGSSTQKEEAQSLLGQIA